MSGRVHVTVRALAHRNRNRLSIRIRVRRVRVVHRSSVRLLTSGRSVRRSDFASRGGRSFNSVMNLH